MFQVNIALTRQGPTFKNKALKRLRSCFFTNLSERNCFRHVLVGVWQISHGDPTANTGYWLGLVLVYSANVP